MNYIKSFYDTGEAMGAKEVSSDFAFEIEGFESAWMLCKQAPWPEITPAGEIEIPGPLGMTMWQPQQIKTAQQGQVSFVETVAGNVDDLLLGILTKGGRFNAKIYEGTPEKYLRYKKIHGCFLQVDIPDRDWENRSQPLLISGTLFYHYFGEVVAGNSSDYN